MTTPWTRSALSGALAAIAVMASLALAGGAVRIFPWLLDPSVTWRVAAPFARSLAVVAVEAAVAVGWPLGWALATLGFVERGEGRVLLLLGERPARTVARLGWQGAVFAAALAGLSWASARESNEPGRIVSELIADGAAACARVDAPRTYTVPFFGATWLCEPGAEPRLVGQGPGPLAALVYTARGAVASGDLGRIELEGAHVAFPGVRLRVDSVRLRGAAPWGHASTVPPLARALTLGLAVSLSALAGVVLVLRGRTRGRLATVVTGSLGPLVALGMLRLAERDPSAEPQLAYLVVLVGLASLAAPLACAAFSAVVVRAGARLPALWHAASK